MAKDTYPTVPLVQNSRARKKSSAGTEGRRQGGSEMPHVLITVRVRQACVGAKYKMGTCQGQKCIEGHTLYVFKSMCVSRKPYSKWHGSKVCFSSGHHASDTCKLGAPPPSPRSRQPPFSNGSDYPHNYRLDSLRLSFQFSK